MDKQTFKALKEHGAYVDSAIEKLEGMLNNPQTFYRQSTLDGNLEEILSNTIEDNKKLMRNIAQAKQDNIMSIAETEALLSSTQVAANSLAEDVNDIQYLLEKFGYDCRAKTEKPVEDAAAADYDSQNLEDMNDLYEEERIEISPGLFVKQRKSVLPKPSSNPNSSNTLKNHFSCQKLDLNESGVSVLTETPVQSSSKDNQKIIF